MTALLRKSTFGRVNTSITAFALILIIMLSCLPISTSLIRTNEAIPSSIPSSGRVLYSSQPSNSSLHVDGRYIRDSSGNVVFLRGANMPGFLDSTNGAWFDGGSMAEWRENVVRNHFAAMRLWGFDHVRLLLCVDWVKNNKKDTLTHGVTDRYCRDALHDTIQIAAEYGIYVVLSFWRVHVDEGQVQEPFPPWTTRTDVIANEAEWVELWVDTMSDEFGIYDNVIYEPFNEPAGGEEAAQPAYFGTLVDIINGLRAKGDNHIVVVQWGYANIVTMMDSNEWVNIWVNDYMPQLTDTSNIVISNHMYRAHGTFPNNEYLYDDVKAVLDPVRRVVEELNMPVWIGEAGTGTGSDDLICWENALRVLNEWGVGYSVWWWRPDGYYALFSYNDVDPPVPENFVPNEAGQILIDAIAASPAPSP